MDVPSIFTFSSHIEFLRAVGQRYLPKGKRTFTAESWAQRLGYRSAQSVTMVLTGARLPSGEMVDKIAEDLGLGSEERRYFELLVQMERLRRAGKSVQRVVEELARLNPAFQSAVPLDAATFAYIAEWYHLVIEQLVGIEGFREDPAWLRERLRRKVTEAEITGALAVLEKLGLLERDEETGALKRVAHGLETAYGVPNQARRAHHKQMMQLAIESLEEQTLDERDTTSLTLRFDARRIGEAREFLQDMKNQFDDRFYSDGASDVYQFNMQLFKHTQALTKGN